MVKEKGYQKHLFICTNPKEGNTCSQKGSVDLRLRLHQWVREEKPDWKGKVRVSPSGCLGYCEDGIVAVCYPKGEWLSKLTDKSDEELKAYLEKEMKS